MYCNLGLRVVMRICRMREITRFRHFVPTFLTCIYRGSRARNVPAAVSGGAGGVIVPLLGSRTATLLQICDDAVSRAWGVAVEGTALLLIIFP